MGARGAAFNNMMEEDSKEELAQRCCDLMDEVADLKSNLDKATRGGCGKPGHTTSPRCDGDSYYCLTCEAEHRKAELESIIRSMAAEAGWNADNWLPKAA